MAESRLTLAPQECPGEEPGPDPTVRPSPPAQLPRRPASAASLSRSPILQQTLVWLLALALLPASQPLTWQWEPPGLWFPPPGVGFLLVAWLGPRAALLVVADCLLVLLQSLAIGIPLVWGPGGVGVVLGIAAALLAGLEVW